MAVFLCGGLCHGPLRRMILGRDVAGQAAVLPGFAVHWARDQAAAGQMFAVLGPGAGAGGLLFRDLSDVEIARLAFYAAVFGAVEQEMAVAGVCARVFVAAAQPGPVWRLEDWDARDRAEGTSTAGDVMALYGVAAPAAVGARLGVMRVRGASRVRAARAAPVTRRLAGDVVVAERRQPYARFFAVEEYDLTYQRFDRTFSPVVTRAVFVSGDAVTVLPYDPSRDRVLVIEQFRAGPYARGDDNPWSLEAIAGRIDPGEGPEDCARREAMEEAGLSLGGLLPVAQYYPSPGAVSEYLYSFVGLADLADGVEGVFGVEGEAEDIRGHLMSLDNLIGLIESGEVENAPLILTALWLQRERGKRDFSAKNQ